MKTAAYMGALVALVATASTLPPKATPLPDGMHDYKNTFYFSAPPAEETIRAMRSIGVKTMVDLREPEEGTAAVAAWAKDNSMTYFSAPVSKAGPIQKEQIRSIEKVIQKHQNQKIWVFCGSGNRAAAWFAIHLASQGLSPELAITEARALGLTNEQMVDKVRVYLSQSPGNQTGKTK